MKTSTVILNYNDGERTAALISKIKNFSSIDYIVIVDNRSTDSSLSILRPLAGPDVFLIDSGSNGGYAKGNNAGIHYCTDILGCDRIFVANPDVSFDDDTCRRMLSCMDENPSYGVIAPLVRQGYNVWDLPSFTGIIESLFLVWFNSDKKNIRKKIIASGCRITDAGVVEGSFFLISKKAYKDAGGFDERTFLYAEEIILAKRLLSKGYREGIMPGIYYDHLHSASIKKQYHSSKAKAFHHFRDSFRIYNKYYLHTNIIQNVIFDIAYALGYLERVIFDLIH